MRSPRVSPGFVQFFFLFAGCFITIFSFMGLNAFVNDIIEEEYERTTEKTFAEMQGGFSAVESAVDTVTAVLFLSQGLDRRTLSEEVNDFIPQIKLFDHILWIYKTEEDKWRFANIYMREMQHNAAGRFTLNPGGELLEYVAQRDLFAVNGTKFIKDFPFTFQGIKGDYAAQNAPFAFVKPVRVNDENLGLLIGVTSAANLLPLQWFEANEQLESVSIHDAADGYHLFHFEDLTQDASSFLKDELSKTIPVGAQKLLIKANIVKSSGLWFLQIVPVSILILGFVATAFGTSFLRVYLSYSSEIKKMYGALENKNLELQNEVTKKEELNKVLRKTEADSSAMVNSVSDIIFELDSTGKVLFLNKAWQNVTGFEVQHSKGLNLFQMVPPQDKDRQVQDFEALVGGNKKPYRSFTQIRTSDGNFRAVEMSISMIRTDREGGRRIVGTLTDVEERRRAERALSEAERKYRAIVENAAGGIFQLTPEGLYLSANNAMGRILGYKNPEDILREIRNASEEVYCDNKHRAQTIKELERVGIINNVEAEVKRRDGERIWIRENMRVVKDESGNILYYEGSMEEITEQRKATEALKEAKMHSDLANRAKSEFLANMSHELRTPLNSIIGFSEIIKNESFGPINPPAYLEYAEHIHESGNALFYVINEVLDISKIEAGERELNDSLVDVEKVVQSTMKLLNHKIENNDMVVTQSISKEASLIAEELSVKQIITNVMSNAIKFTPAGGRITVSSELSHDGYYKLSITDTGIGFNQDDVAKVFEPFSQLNNEHDRGVSGAGLGLTLVKALMEMHGGSLDVLSEKGIGTTVTLVFPPERVNKNAQESESKPAIPEEDETAR